MNSHEVFIHIHQGCFAGTGAIVRLPQCQWSKPDGYGKISQCITTTKRSKAKTVCIFLGIYCNVISWPQKWVLLTSDITPSNVLKYCINSCINWGRISIKCWIHKTHRVSYGDSFMYNCNKVGRFVTAPHGMLIWPSYLVALWSCFGWVLNYHMPGFVDICFWHFIPSCFPNYLS